MQQASKPHFSVDLTSHLIKDALFCPSPNCDEREDETDISLLVVHGISLPPNQFGGKGVTELFTNQLNPQEHPYYQEIAHLRVSAHCFIRRDGELIQFVPFNKRAWHAGVSCFQGVEKCNDFSIGVELEGTDTLAYEDIQYQVLAGLIKSLQKAYPKISLDRLVGHSDIAPGRKTDPGEAFDWQRLKNCLNS